MQMSMEFVYVKIVNAKMFKKKQKIKPMSRNMNYYFTGVLIILLMLFVLFVEPAHPGSTQSNVTGSNTAIEGGYTSE